MSRTLLHPKLLEEAKAQAVMRRSLPQHVTHANRRIPGLYVRMADFIVSSGLIEVTDERQLAAFRSLLQRICRPGHVIDWKT
jgi:hypothetical protein